MLTPRLKTSTKKTDFPNDYVKLIKEVIGKNFKQQLQEKDLVVEGGIYPAEVLIRIGFRDKNSIAQRNFEASVDHSIKAKNIMSQIYIAIDALGSMIDQFFKEEEDLDLPLQWQEFKLDGKAVYLRTSRENSDLEKQADAILAKKDSGKTED